MNSFVFGLFCGLATSVAVLGVGTPSLVTWVDGARGKESTGAGDSMSPAISRDGRRVIFTSRAGNLIPGTGKGMGLDVYAFDLVTERIDRVSQAAPNTPVQGRSFGARVSADGRYVAFLSESNLAGDGLNSGVVNVFVRDTELRRTVLVSKDSSGNGLANRDCQGVQLSADGRRVCFSSRATNLIPESSNGRLNLYVHDLDSGTTRCLTQPDGDAEKGGSDVLEYVMSEDGSSVAFTYEGRLNAVDPKVPTTAYLWTFASGLTQRLGAPGNPLAGFKPIGAYNLAMDAAGHSVVFQTARVPATSVGAFEGGLLLEDPDAQEIRRLSEGVGSVNLWNTPDASGAAVSADGGVVAFLVSGTEAGADGSSSRTVHIWTPEVGDRLLTQSGNGEGIVAENLVLSRDGHRLAFLSRAVLAKGVEGTNELQLYVMDLASKTVRLANRSLDGKASGRVEGSDPMLSGDGRRLAFATRASNLVEWDVNGALDVFVYDWDRDQLTLASRRAVDLPAQTSVKGSRGAVRGISQDGRVVLLETLSPEMVPNETWGLSQFIAQDLPTGRRTLIGMSTNGVTGAQAGIDQAMLSGNGRFVAFVSKSRDLFPKETNGLVNAYLQDLATGTIQLISKRRPGASVFGHATVEIHSISADGRFVIFRTSDMTQFAQVSLLAGHILYDRLAEKMAATWPTIVSSKISPVLASTSGILGIVQNGETFGSLDVKLIPLAGGPVDRFTAPSLQYTGFRLSADGKRCVFFVDGGIQTEILYRDPGMAAAVSLPLPIELHKPLSLRSLSWEGRFALVESGGNAYRFELGTGKAEPVLIEKDGSVPVDSLAEQSVMDLSGEQILFRRAPNASPLLPLHAHGLIHARNMTGKSVAVLSPGTLVSGQIDFSVRPLISGDGRLAVFTSWADDVVNGDFNGLGDVYAVELDGTSPSVLDVDGDGMDDRWEILWFGDLSKNGLQDTDGDGLPDFGEYLAGTVPVDDRSRFELEIVPDQAGAAWIQWKTIPGRTYRLRERLGLEGGWVDRPEVIRGDGRVVRVLGGALELGPRFYQLSVSAGQP